MRSPVGTLSYPRRQQARRLAGALAAGAGAVLALAGSVVAAVAGVWIIAAIVLALAVALGLGCRHWARLASRAAVGARSEADVHRRLAELEREGWRLRHSLTWRGHGDIDHVALSPAGLAFAIETKTRRYDGRHLCTVRAQADWLAAPAPLVPARRSPRLCVTHARHVDTMQEGVLVVSLDGLLRELRARAGSG